MVLKDRIQQIQDRLVNSTVDKAAEVVADRPNRVARITELKAQESNVETAKDLMAIGKALSILDMAAVNRLGMDSLFSTVSTQLQEMITAAVPSTPEVPAADSPQDLLDRLSKAVAEMENAKK